MSGWVWTVVVLVVGVAFVLASLKADRQRRNRLRKRFGPEYDRVVGRGDCRRAGEAQLQDRARRRSRLTIVPLPEEVRAAYAQRWRIVQEESPDRPGDALAAAELLLHQVMVELGYPVVDFEEQADLVSVDHPHVVEDYRVAHAIQQRQEAGEATIEELREALLRHRSLFEDLLRFDLGTVARRGPAESDRGVRTKTTRWERDHREEQP